MGLAWMCRTAYLHFDVYPLHTGSRPDNDVLQETRNQHVQYVCKGNQAIWSVRACARVSVCVCVCVCVPHVVVVGFCEELV